jgi:adenylate kinase
MRVIFLVLLELEKGHNQNLLRKKYHIPKISTGDLLRESVDRQTSLGKEAKGFMDRGDLVPDIVVIRLVKEKLNLRNVKMGFSLTAFLEQ